jgi:hypothetical protein
VGGGAWEDVWGGPQGVRVVDELGWVLRVFWFGDSPRHLGSTQKPSKRKQHPQQCLHCAFTSRPKQHAAAFFAMPCPLCRIPANMLCCALRDHIPPAPGV